MSETKKTIIPKDDIVVLEDHMAHQQDDSVILSENTIILAAGDVYSLINMPLLKKALKDSGKSYQDLGDEIDISKEAIYKFFKGKSKSPSAYLVIMICKALGVSPDELCGIRRSAMSEAEQKLDSLERTVRELQKAVETLTAELHKLYQSDSNNY